MTGSGQRKIQAGFDEAGYGPLLGPLTLAACRARTAANADLEDALAGALVRAPRFADGRLPVADSKRIFTGPHRAERLETTALAWVAACLGHVPKKFGELLALAPDTDRQAAELAAAPWFTGKPSGPIAGLRLPRCADPGAIAAFAATLRDEARAADVELMPPVVSVLPAGAFNARMGLRNNKAAVLFDAFGEVLGSVVLQADGTPIHAVCDRHGGRRRYAPLLAGLFPFRTVTVDFEGPGVSSYLVDEHLAVRFETQADDRHLLPAAASCVAKYVREVCLEVFNAWWGARVPEIAPTAGYVTDGRRFLADLGEQAASVPGTLLVRTR